MVLVVKMILAIVYNSPSLYGNHRRSTLGSKGIGSYYVFVKIPYSFVKCMLLYHRKEMNLMTPNDEDHLVCALFRNTH